MSIITLLLTNSIAQLIATAVIASVAAVVTEATYKG